MLDEFKHTSAYLNVINGSPQEKAGMCEHLVGLGEKDVILEIGPGGGAGLRAFSEIVSKMSKGKTPIVIGVDISLEVLKRLQGLAETTNEGTQEDNKAKRFGVQADATKLPFKDNSISVVNLSSIVHEVFSYGGGEKAIDTMIGELARTVKPGGVVVYRDPEGVELFESATAFLNCEMIRSFAVVFLKKYLANGKTDDTGSPGKSYLGNFRLSIDGKRGELQEVSIEKVVSAKTVLLNCYAGLMHELKRHFVVFMTEFFPEVFRTAENSKENPEQVTCVFSRNSGAKVFREFCGDGQLEYATGEDERTFYVDKTVMGIFEYSTNNRFKSIFNDVGIRCANSKEREKLTDFLRRKKVPHSNKMANDLVIHVPFEELVRIYTDLRKTYAKKCTPTISIRKEVNDACAWFAREGEESYFYGDFIDVLVAFVEKSLIRDREHSVAGYSCFVPISIDHNRFIKRDYYADYVERSVIDIEGKYPDGKRTIHFVKKPVEETFGILFALYQRNGDERLRELLEKLLDLAKTSLETKKSHNEKREAEDALFFDGADNPAVIGLVGGIASGKSSVGEILTEHGFTVVELSDYIRRELEELGVVGASRVDYFDVAGARRREKGNDYWTRKAFEDLRGRIGGNVAISGIRTPEEIEFLRSKFRHILIVAIDAQREIRIERVRSRLRKLDPVSISGILSDMDRELADDKPEGCQLAKALEKVDVTLDSSSDLETLKQNCLALLRSIGKL